MNYYNSQWDEAYTIGHKKIDTEHKRLFEIANEINLCDEDIDKIKPLIKELLKYTKLHFKNEETFMREIKYEQLEEHSTIHREITNNLLGIVNKLETLPAISIIKLIKDFIYNGVLMHILQVDKKVHHVMRNRQQLKSHFNWKEEYKIKETQLDDEHRYLFEIAMEALNYNYRDKDQIKAHIKKTVNKLYEYMKTHFKNEEEFMKTLNYPDTYEHSLHHENIIDEMNKFIKTLPKSNIADFERKLIEYMDIWLINHILYEDRKILIYKNQN